MTTCNRRTILAGWMRILGRGDPGHRLRSRTKRARPIVMSPARASSSNGEARGTALSSGGRQGRRRCGQRRHPAHVPRSRITSPNFRPDGRFPAMLGLLVAALLDGCSSNVDAVISLTR
jgi:hypothetical protein